MPARTNPRDAWSGIGTGWAMVSTMLAGVLAWGGIGYLVDRLAGTPDVFLALGMLVGAGAGTYLIWLKYGKGKSADGS